jgi:acetyl-CoA synthetase
MKQGVAMLAGIDSGLAGVRAAVDVGTVWKRSPRPPLLAGLSRGPLDSVMLLDEAESKDLLARHGIPVPASRIVGSPEEAVRAADALGYPVVVKALGLAHKTEVGGVKLDLGSADEVLAAVTSMADLAGSYLVEKMVDGAVAELIVGVASDEQFGPYLLVGGGGRLVEVIKDSASLLLPIDREQVLQALGGLKCAGLLNGFRGAPPADLDAAADVVLALAAMIEGDPSVIVELDINPLMLLSQGKGALAVDALIRLNTK